MDLKGKAIGLLMIVSMLHDMPCLGFRYPSVIYALLVIALFLLLCSTIYFSDLKRILPVFALPVLNIIPLTVDGSDVMQIFQYISGLMQMMSYPLAAYYIIKTENYKLARILLILYIAISLITCVTTYYGNLMHPGASRALATGMSESPQLMLIYQAANIGGFSFVYNMVILTPLLIFTLKNRKKIAHGILYGIFCLGFFSAIFLALSAAEYTIALLLFVLCLSLFFIGDKLNIKKLLLIGCIGGLVFFILKAPIANMFWNISQHVESANISERLQDISYSLQGNQLDNDSDLSARQEHYGKSMDSFIQYPLGSWTQKTVGGHSFFLDQLGKFGIIGLFLLIILYRRLYAICIKPAQSSDYHGYALFAFFIFIIATVVNPILFLDAIMFVLPLFGFVINSRLNNKILA